MDIIAKVIELESWDKHHQNQNKIVYPYNSISSIYTYGRPFCQKMQNSNHASRESLLVIGKWSQTLQNSFFPERRLGPINLMSRFLIFVLKTILGTFHYSALKNIHFFTVQNVITPYQFFGNCKNWTLGLFPWKIAFNWHQHCISSSIIHWGVGICNPENLIAGNGLQSSKMAL